MSETSNISNFDFYLNFLSDDYGKHQIDEPVGIDAINLLTESEDGRYARDSYFGGDGNVKLTFGSGKGSKDLGYEFEKLIEYDKRFGFESNIEFIITNRVTTDDFVLGRLEFEQKETDHYSYFSCNIDQVKTQAEIKRFKETKVDLFSNEDLNNESIDPVQTYNVLLPAKPIVQVSEFFLPTQSTFNLTGAGLTQQAIYNFGNGQTKYEIQNTLSFIPNPFGDDADTFVYLEAENDIIDLEVSLDIQAELQRFDGGLDYNEGYVRLRYYIGTSLSSGGSEATDIFSINVSDINTATQVPTNIGFDYIWYINDTYTISDLTIPSGHRLWIFWESYYNANFLSELENRMYKQDISFRGKSIGVDTVTNAVRLLDATKQVSSSINQDFELVSPRLDTTGEHYNQFLATGDMIRGRESAFNLEWKDLSEYFLSEPNLDYQVLDTTVFVGKEDDFYPNIEIAAFLQKPDENYVIKNNPRFTINGFEYNFKSFNQDKDDDNTIDAVHTEMELLIPNKFVQDIKEVQIDFIRDPFLIATTQEKAASETSTSLSQDDKVFILDCVSVAPGQTRSFDRSLTHNVNSDGNLQLLGTGFNWEILGFVIGDVFAINSTSNQGSYTVLEITSNIVTLIPASASPTSIGQIITKVTYPLTSVQYALRTNEGFDSITGIESPNEYGNLTRSIKRSILNNYGAYLKTSTTFSPENIKVTYLKNEVDLRTQFEGGTEVSEKDDITQDMLPDPILSHNLINCKVLCSFEKYIDFKNKLETINTVNPPIKTVGGFVRVCNNEGRVVKGFPKKSDSTWANGVMEFELEEKFESKITDITYSGALYFVNATGYDLQGTNILDYAQTDSNYLQLFDPNTLPLTNKLRYDLFSVNGNVYNSITELITAIEAL